MKKKIEECNTEIESAVADSDEREVEELAQETMKASTYVYCGPSVRNVVRQYTVYSGAIPEAVNAFLEVHPTAKALLVPLERFAETRKNLETKGSAEAVLYNKVKSEI